MTFFQFIAFLCNIIVVSGNSFNYIRAGNHNFKIIAFHNRISSICFFGGTFNDKDNFEFFYFLFLSTAGILLLINNKSYEDKNLIIKKLSFHYFFNDWFYARFDFWNCRNWRWRILSPILFLLKAEKPKIIVTTASLFILINSISGVLGQLQKNL